MGFSPCSSCFCSIYPGFGIEETLRKIHFHPPQLPFITNCTKQVNVKKLKCFDYTLRLKIESDNIFEHVA